MFSYSGQLESISSCTNEILHLLGKNEPFSYTFTSSEKIKRTLIKNINKDRDRNTKWEIENEKPEYFN